MLTNTLTTHFTNTSISSLTSFTNNLKYNLTTDF